MDKKILAREDLALLQSARAHATSELKRLAHATNELEKIAIARKELASGYRELLQDGVSVRIDVIDLDDNKSATYYLTKARTGLKLSEGQVYSWTAPIGRMRPLDPGEDEDIPLPGHGTRSLELVRKGRFRPTADDLLDCRYEAVAQSAQYSSARAVIDDREPLPDELVPAGKAFGLREIIFETDRVQDAHLRFDATGHMVIHGAPGSGKTTVALQRIVFVIEEQWDLLGLERDKHEPYFSEESTLVVTYSVALVDYLHRLKQELRIEDVRVVALGNWLDELLRGCHALQTVERSQKKDVPPVVWLKTRPALLPLLRQHGARALLDRFQEFQADFIAAVEQEYPLSEKVRRARVLAPLTACERALTRQGGSAEPLVTLGVEVRSALRAIDATSRATREILAALTRLCAKTANWGDIYLDFLLSDELTGILSEGVDAGVFAKTSAEVAARKLRKQVAGAYVRRHDLPLIGWLCKWGAAGVPKTPEVKFTKPVETIRHLVIDEAQDFSAPELRLLLDCVDSSQRCVTVAGDLMQRLNFPDGLASWGEGGLAVDGEHGRLGVFRINYRQTTPLARLAADFYRHHFSEDVPFEPRPDAPGLAPELVTGGDLQSRLERLAQRLIEIRREHESWTIAVIVDDKDQRSLVHRELKKLLGRHHLKCSKRWSWQDDVGTVHVVSTLQTKGMEFDVVCFVEPATRQHRRSPEQEKRSTYVAITRATHHLVVTCARELPATLAPLVGHFSRSRTI